jgi:DUF971 family protein
MTLAHDLINEIQRLDQETSQLPHVRYETGSMCVVVRQPDGKEKKIKSADLRKKCGCALCVDEFTGNKLLKDENIRPDVFPSKIEPKGNYAVAVMWSDGHRSSIYPYSRLLSDDIPEYKAPASK